MDEPVLSDVEGVNDLGALLTVIFYYQRYASPRQPRSHTLPPRLEACPTEATHPA